jgi:hypothetical protein
MEDSLKVKHECRKSTGLEKLEDSIDAGGRRLSSS